MMADGKMPDAYPHENPMRFIALRVNRQGLSAVRAYADRFARRRKCSKPGE
ncbi:hypothetical protein [Sphingobium sp. B8D3A]|uniref:hypothetical protein n=1 Tax=Sphingobium sp. B8D3A TaxID=2940584 RepID=UPI0022244BFC|nr:hypothetical protein [Sphingobium sp. B8D3A]